MDARDDGWAPFARSKALCDEMIDFTRGLRDGLADDARSASTDLVALAVARAEDAAALAALSHLEAHRADLVAFEAVHAGLVARVAELEADLARGAGGLPPAPPIPVGGGVRGAVLRLVAPTARRLSPRAA